MKRILLDTDMGVDCDDAVALALTLKAENAGLAELVGVTASTTRRGAVATVNAICRYYGKLKPVGVAARKIPCDDLNAYASVCADKFGESDTAEPAVKLMRRLLAGSNGKVTLVAIGPLLNVADLLRSGADEYSPLSGEELVEEKVDEVFIMGGSFAANNAAAGGKSVSVCAEWNIVQDVESAQYVVKTLRRPVVFVPHEAGEFVFTRKGEGDNPVWYAMQKFAEHNGDDMSRPVRRYSWDPITCMSVVYDLSRWFALSPYGKVTVTDEGVTEFAEGEGNARFLMLRGGADVYASLGEYIDELMK